MSSTMIPMWDRSLEEAFSLLISDKQLQTTITWLYESWVVNCPVPESKRFHQLWVSNILNSLTGCSNEVTIVIPNYHVQTHPIRVFKDRCININHDPALGRWIPITWPSGSTPVGRKGFSATVRCPHTLKFSPHNNWMMQELFSSSNSSANQDCRSVGDGKGR
jgi:hypothetical protein